MANEINEKDEVLEEQVPQEEFPISAENGSADDGASEENPEESPELTAEEIEEQAKQDRQRQFGIVIRAAVSGYVVYLGYTALRGILADETQKNNIWMIVLSIVLMIAGAGIAILSVCQLVKTQGIKKKREAEEKGEPVKKRSYIPFVDDFKEAGSNMKRAARMTATGMTPDQQKAAEAEEEAARAAGRPAQSSSQRSAGQSTSGAQSGSRPASGQAQTGNPGSGADIMARLRAMNEADGLEMSDEEE